MKFVKPCCALIAVALLVPSAYALDTHAASRSQPAANPLAPAQAALRSLQFAKAVQLLGELRNNPDAEFLLGLMYLNGVGVPVDPGRAISLFKQSAAQGQGAAAYALAGELSRAGVAGSDAVQEQLQRAAQLGYPLAIEALRSPNSFWGRDFAGASDPSLLIAWTMQCARKNDAAALRQLGVKAAQVRDDFGRGALHHAAAADAEAAAYALLELGADARAADGQGVTPLMLAARAGGAGMLALLIAHGADVSAVDAENRTAAFYAARGNQVKALQVLQQGGAALDARDNRGYNALDAALAVQAQEAAAALRSDGVHAEITLPSSGRQNRKSDPAHPGEIYRGWSPLALAVARNDTAEVARLLDSGADVHARTPQGDTLLQVGADAHAMASVALLLKHGADPSDAGHAGHSPLWLAVVRADLTLVNALLAAGIRADVHARGEEVPLLTAARSRQPAITMALIENGADLGVKDEQGTTPLMIAAGNQQRQVIELLIARKVPLDYQDARGRSALWLAAAAGAGEEARLLLAAGAKPTADSEGFSPLHAAALQPNAEVVEALMGAHLGLDSRTRSGDSALMIAAANGRTEFVQALLAHRPSLDLQNASGDTALIAASRAGHGEVCKLLLDAGANRALRNGSGIGAADVAASRGFTVLAAQISGKQG
jgi:serine/threonine-protein phosphatase 6 regulatory ankyrin repeat subunit B